MFQEIEFKGKQTFEVYQEGEGSSFTHHGKLYDLDKLLRIADTLKQQTVSVADCEWILAYDTPDSRRKENADLTKPVLVSVEKGVYYVVDGLHRLAKATETGVRSLPAKFVSSQDLKACLGPAPVRTETGVYYARLPKSFRL